MISGGNVHNDVSETRNDILQELNNILIAEGEKGGNVNKKKLINPNEINDNDNVIEEENVDANSLLAQGSNENNDNKNLKCKLIWFIYFLINLVPDISNVEVVEEEMEVNRRDKKLNDIRNKYISIGKN
jgi:hypothetical protein